MPEGARPWLSIVVAAFNAADTIADTLDSLQAQTRDDWEAVVVDDGSSDGTAAIAAERAAADPRITVLRQANAGTANARNAGATRARGEYWCFLDADDMLLPEYVERQHAFIAENPGFDIYSTNADFLMRDGSRRRVWRGPRFARPLSLTAEDQFAESSILLMATITPRVFALTGGFRPLHAEDYDLWLRALVLGATHRYDPEVLAVYRRMEGTRTTSLVAEAESFLSIQRDALLMPELTTAQRIAGEKAVAFSEVRVERRKLEEALLAGDFAHARRRYLRTRAAFPDKPKYLLGLLIMLLSPRAYARIKGDRMI